MGCFTICRKPNLNESIYEIAESLSEREKRKTKLEKANLMRNKVCITDVKHLENSKDSQKLECTQLIDLEVNLDLDIKQYITELFDMFNYTRTNVSNMVDKIKKYSQYIDGNDLVYVKDQKEVKITLNKGKEAFEEAIDYLASNTKTLKELKYNSLLEFPNIDENEDLSDFSINIDKISTLYGLHYAKLKQNDIDITGFHYDISPADAELSLILQIVDDNNSKGQRRDNIFNEESEYIGIYSFLYEKNLLFSFITFGKKSLQED